MVLNTKFIEYRGNNNEVQFSELYDMKYIELKKSEKANWKKASKTTEPSDNMGEGGQHRWSDRYGEQGAGKTRSDQRHLRLVTRDWWY